MPALAAVLSRHVGVRYGSIAGDLAGVYLAHVTTPYGSPARRIEHGDGLRSPHHCLFW